MKNPKQIREIVFLCVAIAVLAIVAVVSFKGSSTPPPPPQRQSARAAGAKTTKNAPAKKPAADTAEWVDSGRLMLLVSEVNGGRNPFKSFLPPVTNGQLKPNPKPDPQPVNDPIPPTYNGGQLPGLADVPIDVQRAVTLHWVSRQQLVARIKPDYPDVRVEAGKKPEQVVLVGPKFDVAEIVTMLPSFDVEPPAPPFELVGIITNSAQSFAIISLDGTTYSLNKGEAISTVGWTVSEITPTGVTLKKGKQIKSLRLAGGKA